MRHNHTRNTTSHKWMRSGEMATPSSRSAPLLLRDDGRPSLAASVDSANARALAVGTATRTRVLWTIPSSRALSHPFPRPASPLQAPKSSPSGAHRRSPERAKATDGGEGHAAGPASTGVLEEASAPTRSAGPPTSPQNALNESAWIRDLVEEKRKRSDNAVARMKQVDLHAASFAQCASAMHMRCTNQVLMVQDLTCRCVNPARRKGAAGTRRSSKQNQEHTQPRERCMCARGRRAE